MAAVGVFTLVADLMADGATTKVADFTVGLRGVLTGPAVVPMAHPAAPLDEAASQGPDEVRVCLAFVRG